MSIRFGVPRRAGMERTGSSGVLIYLRVTQVAVTEVNQPDKASS